MANCPFRVLVRTRPLELDCPSDDFVLWNDFVDSSKNPRPSGL